MILRGSIFSKTLEMDTGITVVGPDTFTPDGPYKVVYLFHGLCGSSGSWADNSKLGYYARDLGALFVLPEVGRSFYTDQKYGQLYFSYVSRELPELALRLFNISSARADTAVMGGSMGGFGALKCALARPDFFGHVAAMSPCCLFMGEDLAAFGAGAGAEKAAAKPSGKNDWQPNSQMLRDFAAMFGPGMELSDTDEIMKLAAKVPAALRPRLYTSCGLEDAFLPALRRFAGEMRNLGYDISCEEWPGRHNWRFFDEALEKAIVWLFGVDLAQDQGRYKALGNS